MGFVKKHQQKQIQAGESANLNQEEDNRRRYHKKFMRKRWNGIAVFERIPLGLYNPKNHWALQWMGFEPVWRRGVLVLKMTPVLRSHFFLRVGFFGGWLLGILRVPQLLPSPWTPWVVGGLGWWFGILRAPVSNNPFQRS